MSSASGLPRDRVLFGAAYYLEYQPGDTLERDLDLMVQARFSVIRVGESVWSTWEPADGVFELDWLQPVLDGAHARGIRVILGTPTYAAPPWLQTLHPEIAAENRDGSTVGWGQRQEMDYTHPTFQRYAERIVRKVVERYADHPAIIGFQVDNEPGQQLPHNPHVIEGFRDWLRERYGTVERLNAEWGLVYWSHRIGDWSELWTPKGNIQPQYELEWRRYQSQIMTRYISWQADIVREYARDDQFVTTCISYSRPPVSDDELVAALDVTAGNPYYKMQDGLAARVGSASEQPWLSSGTWALFGQADRMYSSAQERFLVTETNAQTIGGSAQNHVPFPGQIIQAGTTLVARGARMVEYWHWHSLHFGVETYWGGVLPHSQRPGRIYREVAELGRVLEAIGPHLEGYVPDADAGIIWSTDTDWSFQGYPPLAQPDGTADPRSFVRIFDGFAQGAWEAGLQLRVLHDRQFAASDPAELARELPVLFVPALYVADDATLDHLVAYAEAGGHLVAGIRTGYGDRLARARVAVAPDRLHEAAGVWYEEFDNLDADLPLAAEGGFMMEPKSRATAWADGLQADGAEVLARYVHPVFEAFPAITTRAHGAGRITYVGTVPDPALGRSIARFAVPEPIAAAWRADPTVSVASGIAGGRRIVFVHNWSHEAAAATVPADGTDLVSGDTVLATTRLALEPWSVRILALG